MKGEEWAIGAIPAFIVGAGLWWDLRYGPPPAGFFPILLFHKVDSHWEWGGTRLSPPSFHRKMKFLHQLGYHTIPLSQYLNHLIEGTTPPQRTFALTFDDAYCGLLEYALPLLNELEFTATIFAPSAHLGKENDWELRFGARFRHMTGAELREVIKAGHEVGSHGRKHVPLTGLGKDELTAELVGSKMDLESVVGQEVNSMSYPYGRTNEHVRIMTRRAGYLGACGSYPGKKSSVVDRFELRRLGVYSIDTKRTVAVKLQGKPIWAWATLDLAMRLINRFSIFSQVARVLKAR